MNFIKQTKFKKEGNCLEACISSLTGIDINDFPDLSSGEYDGEKFWTALNDFLTKKYSLYVESLEYSKNDKIHIYNRGILIAVGKTPLSKDLLHAVLWDFDKSEMIFDPSPDNLGLIGNPTHYCIIVNHYNLTIED